MKKHLVIPDCQVKPGVPTYHLGWIGRYIMDIRPDEIIQIGDFADMPSLSSYDRGKLSFEGRRVKEDIKSVRKALNLLLAPLKRHQKRANATYFPKLHLTLGNHEHRINRACQDTPELDGWLSVDDLGYEEAGFTVYPFLEVAEIDGIQYSHFFPRNAKGRVMQSKSGAPSAVAQAVREMQSSTAGHTQGLEYHIHQLHKRRIYACIAGSCYLHNESYLTPQGCNEWQGVIVKHEVQNGEYDIMTVSLDYLCRKYEGVTLDEFKQVCHI